MNDEVNSVPDISGTELIQGIMTYRLRSATENTSSGKHPLLIMLHGRGANEGDIYELVPFIRRNIIIAAPRAPELFDNNPRGAYRWFAWTPNQEIGIEQFVNTAKKLAELVTELTFKYPVDSSKIYFGGMSQGAAMACLMSLLKPTRVKGVIAHSGFLPYHPELTKLYRNAKGKPYFFAHGTEDNVVSIERSRHVANAFSKAGARIVYNEYPMAHTTSIESRHDLADWLHNEVK
ncbi:MAG: dienelactone hydrolase family protein [Chloroflexi bacterium]|uniref:Dienelactone hydrolase family protein n=1 Tax=Candidatus Chlorohelix allophototropha TaxID=3003348 RepID=A0A8T7M190_9CHLR|nr:dienelactone hydrolase family protein [Chloroflexota bacterium]WJW67619.1 dienelactone hydrolase family protein [Chloroflexota bacterium L227-S17]